MVIRPDRELREINGTKDEFNFQHDCFPEWGDSLTYDLYSANHSAATGFILLQKESQKEHDGRRDSKNLKCIDVSQAGRLRLQTPINPGVRRDLRLMLAHTGESPDAELARLPNS